MNDPYTDRHTPTEIRVKREEKILEVDFDDGKSFALPAELLRVESPSAEVQGHGPGQNQVCLGNGIAPRRGVDGGKAWRRHCPGARWRRSVTLW